MRRLAFTMIAALAAGAASAQDAVIRIEAKRGDALATEAARGWAEQFDDVVTFPLSGGWVAVALGPLDRAEADARLTRLKTDGTVPGDAFVAEPAGVTLTAVAGDAPADATKPDTAQTQDTSEPDTTEVEEVTIQPDQPPMPEAGSYIRLQSVRSEGEGREALTKWRESFPEAGLIAMPGGWRTVALGPLSDAAAKAWLAAFKASGDLPKDAFASDASQLGEVIEAGKTPDLPEAGEPQEMPPLEEVQRALRWAGRYDGAIDGQSGPKTREAIAKEVAAERASPDAGTAMRKLIERRAAWREEFGLTTLKDEATGLKLTAPMQRLVFDRAERALSIYGPKDDSGVALILFSQNGGQQELLDLSGLVTALGWVPHPTRMIEPGHVLLQGADMAHIGRAEGWVRDGRAEGFVLIWPADDQENQARIAAEMSDSLTRVAPAQNDAPKSTDEAPEAPSPVAP